MCPPGPNTFNFMQFNFHMLALPWRVGAPPQGNPGSVTANPQNLSLFKEPWLHPRSLWAHQTPVPLGWVDLGSLGNLSCFVTQYGSIHGFSVHIRIIWGNQTADGNNRTIAFYTLSCMIFLSTLCITENGLKIKGVNCEPSPRVQGFGELTKIKGNRSR